MKNTRKDFELTPIYRWHDNEKEPIPTEDNWEKDYVVRLYNGNRRIVYWDIHTFKDCVTGEHIPLDVIKLWIELPKEN
jgi:hypothetical protein